MSTSGGGSAFLTGLAAARPVSAATGTGYFATNTGVLSVFSGGWISVLGSGDLLAANNLSDVASAATARTNLGLGTASTPTFAGLTLTGAAALSTATFADPAAVLATAATVWAGLQVAADTNDRLQLTPGSVLLGSGAIAPDIRFQRTAAHTVTLDDGAAGNATLRFPTVSGQINFGATCNISSDGGNQFRVQGNCVATGVVIGTNGSVAASVGNVGPASASGVAFQNGEGSISRVSAGRFHFSKVNANGFDVATGAYAGGTDVGGCLSFGTGAPVNANGTDGDIYLRVDGGALTTVYQRRSGVWAGIV